jgi:intein/homing endonuclease
MICNCMYCGKELDRIPSRIKRNNVFCNASCQLKFEYDTGVRDRVNIGVKARKVSQAKMKENNWLNSKDSRAELKKAQQKDSYKLKCSLAKLGSKNGMFGKKPGNYIDGKYRKWGNAWRGFNWKKIKKMVKERDGYCCVDCGVKEESPFYLQVHHIVPFRLTQDNSLDNLITVCPKCHAKREPKYLKINKITKVKDSVKVYNFSVDKDESYLANDLIVHNCRSVLNYSVVGDEE